MIDIRYCKHCEKEIFFDELTNKWIHRDNGFPQCYFKVAEPIPLKRNCEYSLQLVNIEKQVEVKIRCKLPHNHDDRHYGKVGSYTVYWEW